MTKQKVSENEYMKLGKLSVEGQSDTQAAVAEFQNTTDQNEAPKSRKIDPHMFFVVAGLAAILASLGMVITFKHGSLAPITVAGKKVNATTSQAELEKSIAVAASKYKVKVLYVDGKHLEFPLKQTGVNVDVAKSAREAKNTINHSYLGRLKWWQPINIDLKTKTDTKALAAFVNYNITVVKEAPVDASLSVAGGTAAITADKQGSGSSLRQPKVELKSVISRLSNKQLVMKPTTIPVSIKAKDLEASRAKAEELLGKNVVFSIAGHSVKAAPGDIAGWLDLNPVPKAKTVDVTVNSGKVLQYINNVSYRYITPPKSRLITNTDQGQVVLDNGYDGVDVVNKDKTAADVATRLAKGSDLNINLSVKYTPASTIETDAYPKWFVADITTKRMYAYEGTTLVKSFLISAGAPATPTITGTYKINRKYVSQDMYGANADGSRYFQPSVPYVNYFSGGYAIHGNYWRPASYFGNINSSHGCIGISVSDAAWIYDWAPVGTAVVIHR